MRQLLIDELRKQEVEKIHSYLKSHAQSGPIDGIYWLFIPQDLWSQAQHGHHNCSPFYFAMEVGEDFCSYELLVRAQNSLHCSCITYATPAQRNFLLQFADRLCNTEAIIS